MLRLGIALAAVALLGLAPESQAQLPAGNGRVKFVPIDTTRNLATPIPTVNMPQPKESFFAQLYNALAKIIPFVPSSKRNPLAPPLAPVMQLPKASQSQLPPPQSPTFKLPNIPQIPPVVSGTIR